MDPKTRKKLNVVVEFDSDFIVPKSDFHWNLSHGNPNGQWCTTATDRFGSTGFANGVDSDH